MSDPLNPPDPQGDLGLFGAKEKLILPDEEMHEETEEASVPAAEKPKKEPVQKPEPAEAPEEEPDLIQAFLAEEKKPSEESEITKLRQENSRLQGMLEGRLASLESQVRTPEPVKEEEEDYFNSPAVQAVLHRVRDENPEQYEATLVRIAEKRMEDRMEAKMQAVEQRLEQQAQQAQLREQATQIQVGVKSVLNRIRAEGGVSAQIIDDFENRKQESFLWKKFAANQHLILAGEDGIRAAVIGIERELRAPRQQPSTRESVEPSIEASAASGRPSMRGTSLGDKPTELSEEDKIAESMFTVGQRSKKVPFL